MAALEGADVYEQGGILHLSQGSEAPLSGQRGRSDAITLTAGIKVCAVQSVTEPTARGTQRIPHFGGARRQTHRFHHNQGSNTGYMRSVTLIRQRA